MLEKLGESIKSLRKELGMSQQELADKSGVERSQISKIEKGLVPGVTYITVSKIYESLGYSLELSKEVKKFDKLHPFVKWAGGKAQLLSVIENHMPKNFNKYFEPFVGGGALMFNLQPEKIYINDMNSELISAYKCFCDDELFMLLKEELLKHEANHSEEYYYTVREMDRKPEFSSLPLYVRAARMIYLNKACFNGLYRVNSKGFFNVPSGKKEKVTSFTEDNFNDLREFFRSRSIVITNTDFELAVKDALPGDFVYFDPPYDTWDDKNSFTSYGKDAFGKDEQARLADLYRELDKKGVYVMLSNHNTSYINELYDGFTINVIPAKRMINSKASGRGNVEEVLITNYE